MPAVAILFAIFAVQEKCPTNQSTQLPIHSLRVEKFWHDPCG